jgi:hypothetical protein
VASREMLPNIDYETHSSETEELWTARPSARRLVDEVPNWDSSSVTGNRGGGWDELSVDAVPLLQVDLSGCESRRQTFHHEASRSNLRSHSMYGHVWLRYEKFNHG